MKLNRYTNEIERLTIIPTTISKIDTYSLSHIRFSDTENQCVSVCQDPSVSYIMKTMISITFGVFLSFDIETLQNPRNSEESNISNTSYM